MTVSMFLNGRVALHGGDCIAVLAGMDENSVDSVVCDPPYHLTSIVKRFGAEGAAEATGGVYRRSGAGFMGKLWDGGDIAFQPSTWAAVLRVLKPGGYLLAFASTRGFGRMQVAIEDAGFTTHPLIEFLISTDPELRKFLGSLSVEQIEAFVRIVDMHDGGILSWIFGSGFPKATRIKAEGYDGFRYGGQALKPAIEMIYMGQKPFSEDTGTANILRWGTGAVNIDGCRVEAGSELQSGRYNTGAPYGVHPTGLAGSFEYDGSKGRWPANVITDGSDEVLAAFPETASGTYSGRRNEPKTANTFGKFALQDEAGHVGDFGSAARFFYSSKADAEDRLGSKHPTVKPLDLMQYLVRLVTPPGGLVLDPFAGTGTTGEAAFREGMRAILIEREPEYQAEIARRMELAENPTKRAAVARTKNNLQGAEGTPLFSTEATP